jgi:hypothetical protein
MTSENPPKLFSKILRGTLGAARKITQRQNGKAQQDSFEKMTYLVSSLSQRADSYIDALRPDRAGHCATIGATSPIAAARRALGRVGDRSVTRLPAFDHRGRKAFGANGVTLCFVEILKP